MKNILLIVPQQQLPLGDGCETWRAGEFVRSNRLERYVDVIKYTNTVVPQMHLAGIRETRRVGGKVNKRD